MSSFVGLRLCSASRLTFFFQRRQARRRFRCCFTPALHNKLAVCHRIEMSRTSVTSQGKSCQKLLFEETFSVDPTIPGSAPKSGIMFFEDRRLFNIAALTYSEATCNEIMSLIASGLTPSDDWVTLQKSLLLLRTIVLHGSEIAVDRAIQFSPDVYTLQTYNSALAPRRSSISYFSSSSKGGSGGTDFGAPVRKEAVLLFKLLNDDNEIRSGRAGARSSETLVLCHYHNYAGRRSSCLLPACFLIAFCLLPSSTSCDRPYLFRSLTPHTI